MRIGITNTRYIVLSAFKAGTNNIGCDASLARNTNSPANALNAQARFLYAKSMSSSWFVVPYISSEASCDVSLSLVETCIWPLVSTDK